jgi:hypothetical protein
MKESRGCSPLQIFDSSTAAGDHVLTRGNTVATLSNFLPKTLYLDQKKEIEPDLSTVASSVCVETIVTRRGSALYCSK